MLHPNNVGQVDQMDKTFTYNSISSNGKQRGGPIWNKYELENDLSLDLNSRSSSYFCQSRVPLVNNRMLKALRSYSDHEDCDIRICLHDQPGAAFHDMINLHLSTNFYRPHKHLKFSETYHILEGKLGIAFFDKNGIIKNQCVLSIGSVMATRVPVEVLHAVFPLSPTVIFHESKPGPFVPGEDTVYPSWLPNSEDPVSINRYKESLKAIFI